MWGGGGGGGESAYYSVFSFCDWSQSPFILPFAKVGWCEMLSGMNITSIPILVHQTSKRDRYINFMDMCQE